MEFPIYMKAYDKWYIKLINENEILEIKHDWNTELVSRDKINFTYTITSYRNDWLVKEWLSDLDKTYEPNCTEITKDEFVKAYFETVYKLNNLLLEEE